LSDIDKLSVGNEIKIDAMKMHDSPYGKRREDLERIKAARK